MATTPRQARLFLALALVTMALAACDAGGAMPRSGKRLRLGDDLLAVGPSVRVSDSIAGDAMLAGGDVRFSGVIGGDYLGAGGEQTVAGSIGGDLRLAGGDVDISASVGRNATVAGGTVQLHDSTVIGGNAYVAGGDVEVDGTVRRYLHVAGGEVVLDAVVDGDVRVEADRLEVGRRARIAGSLRYRVPAENVHIDPGAQILGQRVALPPKERGRRGLGYFRLVLLLGFLAAGAAAVALFPRTTAAAGDALRTRPWVSAGLGLLWIIVLPVAAVIVLITVIGIPLALIVAALYVMSLYLGRMIVALWLGRLMLRGR
ncbi:MAG: hypothetical protein HY561_11335, partial [Gemmatimonadetes bacterium]|nr:hypothetical protein [Gemmatimonadota bacterium]